MLCRQLFLAVLRAVFLAGAFLAVLRAVDFFAGLFLVVARFVVARLVAFFAEDFLAVFLAGDFFAVDFFAVDFLAVFLAGDFFAVFLAVDFLAVDFLAADFFAAAVVVDRLLVAALATATLGSFFAPDTTAFSSAPARKRGTADFFARTRSPVLGLRTMRAGRTAFSNAPKPVMATFSPRATSRAIVSTTASSASDAAFLLPSKLAERVSMNWDLFTGFPFDERGRGRSDCGER